MALSFEALRRLLRHSGELLLLRADLAAEELALARSRWIGWLVAGACAVALFALAVAAAGGWLTLLLWDRFGAGTLGALALLLLVAGALLIRSLLQSVQTAPAALARTRGAVREDLAAIAAAVPERTAENEP